MTEEVLQAIREAAAEAWKDSKVQSADYADDVVRRVEAKLSPKHPPRGAICEVWFTDEGNSLREIMVSDGMGTFGTFEDGTSNAKIRDHYRVIPTAQDALDALRHEFSFAPLTAGDAIDPQVRTCLERLIDNAMEG